MKKKKLKALFVSPYFPYPTLFGGVFDVWEKIIGLKKLGYEIDLAYTDKTKPDEKDLEYVKGYIGKLYHAERKNNFLDLFHINPLQVVSRKKLKDLHFQKKYDLVVLESENVSNVLKNKTLIFNKYVVRVHNNESKYFFNLFKSSTNILKKAYFFQEAIKYKYFSNRIFKLADRLWFISYDEFSEYKKKKNNAIHLPPPINQKFEKQSLTSKNVLFIGSLFMVNNIEAIKWYLDSVHQEIIEKEPSYNLIICGSTGQYTATEIRNQFSKYKNITLYLNVKNLLNIYSQASVFINPMLRGAGVKIKSINAIVNGLPIVSTNIGIEGIGFNNKEMFLLADTAKEFCESVLYILNSDKKQEIVTNAQQYLKNNNYLKVLEEELIFLNV